MLSVPILILLVLVLAWILPLLYTRTTESLRSRGGSVSGSTNDPSKVSAARRNFFWTLFVSIGWCLLSLAAYQRYSGLERGMNVVISLMWVIATLLRYRRWRQLRLIVGSYEQPGIISNPRK